MLDTALTDQPTADQRRRAVSTLKRHARDSRDEAELMAMLGLDQDTETQPAPRHPHSVLSAAELFELLAPLAAGRAEALVP